MDNRLLRSHIKWAEAAKGPELFPYYDTAEKLTIGYGRNLSDRGISEEEAELMLDNDISSAIADAESLPYWDRLNAVRQLVVTDMIYNLGLSKFRKFVKLNAALTIGDYSLAAHEMVDSEWYHQVKRRARVLMRAMLTGLWGYR